MLKVTLGLGGGMSLFLPKDFYPNFHPEAQKQASIIANALHEKRCRIATGLDIAEEQVNILRSQLEKAKAALDRYATDGTFWALIIAEARAGRVSGEIADIGSRWAKEALKELGG